MSDRRRLVSCLLLSVVALGFLVADAGAESIQAAIAIPYMGYVRLTMGRFSGSIQPAIAYFEMWDGHTGIRIETSGYWSFTFSCESVAISGLGGSVSASCGGYGGYAKFWTEGFYPYARATLQFYLLDTVYGLKGQFVGFFGD